MTTENQAPEGGPALREALKHFADFPLEEFNMQSKPDDKVITGFNDWILLVGHIRKARAALAALAAQTEDDAPYTNAAFERGYQHGRQQERQLQEARQALAEGDAWRHRAIRWLRDMQTADVKSAYFTNGMFKADCANLIDALSDPQPKGTVEAFDAAIAAELPRVSHVEYDSHAICKWFAGEVRKRLATAAPAPAPDLCPSSGLWCAGSCKVKPAPAVGATPLTIQQIERGLASAIEIPTAYERAAFGKGVRFAESAHGIKAAQPPVQGTGGEA